MKRIMCALMAALTLVPIFAGCQSEKPAGAEPPSDAVPETAETSLAETAYVSDDGFPAGLDVLLKDEKNLNFTLDLPYALPNPWSYAMMLYKEWESDWAEIQKKPGVSDPLLIPDRLTEYTLNVDAAEKANVNGEKTVYVSRKSRALDTLDGFTPADGETALYDEYGGYMGGERYEATGFFRVEKIGDRWWSIDPLGWPFYRTALSVISVSEAEASASQRQNILAGYGSEKAWGEAVTQLSKDLGFNAAGCWSDIGLLRGAPQPLALTDNLFCLVNYAWKRGYSIDGTGKTEFRDGLMLVFDPDFVTNTLSRVNTMVSPYKDDPAIYGWMSDNELPDDRDVIYNYLECDPSVPGNAYCYATAWTFLYMLSGQKADVSLEDAKKNDARDLFRAMIFNRYYRVVSQAIDTFDPNHLYIGSRLVDGCYHNEEIMKIAGYWCDVISFNYYFVWTPETQLLQKIMQWTDSPFLCTEWYAKGMDVCTPETGMTNTAGVGWAVRTQEDRGIFYQNYALKLMECPACVGFDWFKYMDNDPFRADADPSNLNANKGIVDSHGNLYIPLTDRMRTLNSTKYSVIEFLDKRSGLKTR